MVGFSEYLYALKNANAISPCYKIEILDEGDRPRFSITDDILEGGSLNVAVNNGQRRTASLTLFNGHNKYSLGPLGIFYGDKIKLSVGIMVGGEPYYIPQAILYVSKVTASTTSNTNNISLTLVDKWARLDGTIYGKIPSKVEYKKTITVYRNSSKIIPGSDYGESKGVNQSAMLSTDFILNEKAVFTEATEGTNNSLSFPEKVSPRVDIAKTTFKIGELNLGFKVRPNSEGKIYFYITYGKITLLFTTFFLGSDVNGLLLIGTGTKENMSYKYSSAEEYDIGIIYRNNNIAITVNGDTYSAEGDNEASELIFQTFSPVEFTNIVFVGSYNVYYDYNIYELIRSTLKKNIRYDVRIIDYLPSEITYTNDNSLNQILNNRIGGLNSLYPLRDFVQFTSDDTVYQCLTNERDSTGHYNPTWGKYEFNKGEVIDGLDPLLDSYYFPVFENDKVEINGIKYDKAALPYGYLTLPQSITLERGSTEAEALLKFAELLSAEIGYNNEGRLFVRPTDREIDYNKLETIWKFTKDEYFFTKQEEYDFSNIVNYVVVTGSTIDGVELTEAVSNEDARSDFCIQKLGVIPYLYQLSYSYNPKAWISEEDEGGYKNIRKNMRELAQWFLRRNEYFQTAVTISCPLIPHMEENKIIELESSDGRWSRYVVNSFNIPIDFKGSMTIKCTKVG